VRFRTIIELVERCQLLTELKDLRQKSNSLASVMKVGLVLLLSGLLLGLSIGSQKVAKAYSLSNPSWWNGTCDVGDAPSGVYGVVAATWNGLQACYPTYYDSSNNKETFYPTSGHQPDFYAHIPGQVLTDAWECAELSIRYLYLASNGTLQALFGDASQIVDNYYNTYKSTVPLTEGSGTILSAANQPSTGDVVSIEWHNSGGPHTGIVTSTSINSSGNGFIYLFQQNAYGGSGPWPNGYLVVSNWQVEDATLNSYPLDMFKWLHLGTSNTFSGHEVYTIGSNGHLYHYLNTTGNPASNWSASPQEDLSATTATTGVTLQGNTASYYFGGNHFIYAIDTVGHLHEYWYASGWHHQDLSAFASVNQTFTGSPSAYAFADPTISNATHHSVYAIGTDGHLYDVSYTPSTGWAKSAALGSTSQSGTPSGYPVIISSATGNTYLEFVYTVTTDGAVQEFLNNNGSWGTTPVNSWTHLTTGGVTATGSPSAYAFTDSGGHQDYSVFVKGSDNLLYNWQYRFTGTPPNYYAWQSAAALSPTVQITGTPNGHISYQTPSYVHFAFAETSAGGLAEFYQNDGDATWHEQTLVASGLSGSPFGYSYFYQPPSGSAILTHIVFWPSTDGDIHETYYQTAWTSIDLHALSSTVTVTGSPSAYGF
jgi:hypothetical protein